MRAAKKKPAVPAPCDRCGGTTNHSVLKEFVEPFADESLDYYSQTRYQVCKCQGCNTVRFRKEFTNNEDCNPSGGSPEITVFPEQRSVKHKGNREIRKLPVVGNIYFETVVAYNSNCLILAAGGLRAIVEAICKQNEVEGKNLEKKIDALVERQLLAKPQAELLHEERYIGNAALHEIERPEESEIETGIEIIEGLLNTIYILPSKAEKLRKTRKGRGKVP